MSYINITEIILLMYHWLKNFQISEVRPKVTKWSLTYLKLNKLFLEDRVLSDSIFFQRLMVLSKLTVLSFLMLL